jgi:transitional endoplasmic reticulum ATPase
LIARSALSKQRPRAKLGRQVLDGVLGTHTPNADARRPIWRRYIEEITDEQIDLEALVRASELFTPADIEFAAIDRSAR